MTSVTLPGLISQTWQSFTRASDIIQLHSTSHCIQIDLQSVQCLFKRLRIWIFRFRPFQWLFIRLSVNGKNVINLMLAFLNDSTKTEQGENSNQNWPEVTELRFLGMNCQVGQHSRLRAITLPSSSRDTPTLAEEGWRHAVKIHKCIHVKCPPYDGLIWWGLAACEHKSHQDKCMKHFIKMTTFRDGYSLVIVDASKLHLTE